MTKVILNIDDHNNILFDCMNHAGNPEACRAVSALCGVLGIETTRIGKEPTTYEPGHMRVDLFEAPETTVTVFQDVFEAIIQLSYLYKDCIQIY